MFFNLHTLIFKAGGKCSANEVSAVLDKTHDLAFFLVAENSTQFNTKALWETLTKGGLGFKLLAVTRKGSSVYLEQLL